MSWFEEQLRYREESDSTVFSNAVDSIADAVMGSRLRNALSEKEIAGSAIEEILKYYHFREKEKDNLPQFQTVDEQVEYRMRPFGIKNRKVILDKGWYRVAVGPMLGTLAESGTAVALIPGKVSGYRIINALTGKAERVSRKNEEKLDKEALCFYEPLPQKTLKVTDLLRFMLKQIRTSDIVLYLLLMGASTMLGLLAPMFTKWLFNDVLETGDVKVLLSLAVFMVGYSISSITFGTFKALINSRIGTKQNVAVQAAVMNRMMSLPTTFFRKYSSGELSQRITYVQSLCTTIFSSIGLTGLTSLFSLVYLGQIFVFAPSLLAPSLVITAVQIIVMLATTFLQMRITREKMDISTKLSGLTYSTITGIQKIKLTGAERRMFSRWAGLYAPLARLEYNPPAFLKLNGTINLVITLVGTMAMYAVSIANRVSVADYYAFNTAYGMAGSAFMAFANIAITIAGIRPTLEMARPILEAEPEVHEGKENISELRGAIEVSHVSFRYDEGMPNVIDDLSLRVQPGEYLAIVGRTGCGKSTLLRLLLGFETPQKGIITYDRKDIASIDPESLRRKIGVVMQNGKLFQGDIYSNIVITAPHLGLDRAWEAAEIASIADDIREMPMGMHTVICEGQGGMSGGQKQRLMIARAVAPKPKILMFDEATSALDNITQKKVTEAIDSLKCTRIVIAHRLSTIRHADRIIFLEEGKVIEEGTYEELIAKNGPFAKLVERQRLDIEDPE